MYVGEGAGSDHVALTVATTASTHAARRLTSRPPGTDLGAFSSGYCDPRLAEYDNYVYAPANPENAGPQSGATPDTVYLLGSMAYNEENNTGSGRDNGRAVTLSTDGGATFTDMTEDRPEGTTQPGALHPDHHALVTGTRSTTSSSSTSATAASTAPTACSTDDRGRLRQPAARGSSERGGPGGYCQVMLSRVPDNLDGDQPRPADAARCTRSTTSRAPTRTGSQPARRTTVRGRNEWARPDVGCRSTSPTAAPRQLRRDGRGSELGRMTSFQSGQLEVRFNPQHAVGRQLDRRQPHRSLPPYAFEERGVHGARDLRPEFPGTCSPNASMSCARRTRDQPDVHER